MLAGKRGESMTEEEAKIVLGITVLFIALILLELMLVNWDTCSRIFYLLFGIKVVWVLLFDFANKK